MALLAFTKVKSVNTFVHFCKEVGDSDVVLLEETWSGKIDELHAAGGGVWKVCSL